MATGAQSFYSTPAFELFRRGLNAQTIKKFRGINAFQAQTLLGPEWALDCLNVMVPGWGGLSKFRLPVSLGAAAIGNVGPSQFVDFQQGTGTRQVVASFPDNSLRYFAWNADGKTLANATLIELAANDAPPWSMVESNNLLFMANGQRMVKWTGATLQNWGIAAPVAAPAFGATAGADAFHTPGATIRATVQRAANVVTVISAGPTLNLSVNDVITVVISALDASFLGSFKVASVVSSTQWTFAQTGANAGPFGVSISVPSDGSLYNAQAAPNGASRTAGVSTVTATAAFTPVEAVIAKTPPFVTVAAMADATFNGTFPVVSWNQVAGTVTYTQPGLPDATSGGGTISFGITTVTGRKYAYAYKNSVTGHVSNISPSVLAPPITNRIPWVYAAASTDPQVDTVVWFGTLDGGGDFFEITELPHFASNQNSGINITYFNALFDFWSDGGLDQSTQGPLINNPPPVGKYLAVGQSRVFIANLTGGKNFIAYSGYEQILLGRPEESFPPGNRLLLQIGAEAINGIGVLQMGVVAFSATKKMYMLRGNVEDIVLAAPVAFSAFLEELPWNVGTLTHDSIQSTPYGLLFWATDKTVQLFDGSSSLTDISGPVYPVLRRATAGQESLAKSCYFNWLERDWYGLTFAIDGSLTNNFVIWWALDKDTGQIDIFPSSIQADSMAVLTTPQLQRILAIAQAGVIKNLPVSQDTAGGISDRSLIPATAGPLNAFWRSGYFGNDSPQRSKLYKRGMIVSDQQGFTATKRLVNNGSSTVAAPKIFGPDAIKGSVFSIGQRAARCSVEIGFPPLDVAANLLELTVGAIATSDRL